MHQNYVLSMQPNPYYTINENSVWVITRIYFKLQEYKYNITYNSLNRLLRFILCDSVETSVLEPVYLNTRARTLMDDRN